MAGAVFLKNAPAMPFSDIIIVLGTFLVHAGQNTSTVLYSVHKIVKGGIYMTFKKFFAALINTHFYLVH